MEAWAHPDEEEVTVWLPWRMHMTSKSFTHPRESVPLPLFFGSL